jgi:hypothetical protein
MTTRVFRHGRFVCRQSMGLFTICTATSPSGPVRLRARIERWCVAVHGTTRPPAANQTSGRVPARARRLRRRLSRGLREGVLARTGAGARFTRQTKTAVSFFACFACFAVTPAASDLRFQSPKRRSVSSASSVVTPAPLCFRRVFRRHPPALLARFEISDFTRKKGIRVR